MSSGSGPKYFWRRWISFIVIFVPVFLLQLQSVFESIPDGFPNNAVYVEGGIENDRLQLRRDRIGAEGGFSWIFLTSYLFAAGSRCFSLA